MTVKRVPFFFSCRVVRRPSFPPSSSLIIPSQRRRRVEQVASFLLHTRLVPVDGLISCTHTHTESSWHLVYFSVAANHCRHCHCQLRRRDGRARGRQQQQQQQHVSLCIAARKLFRSLQDTRPFSSRNNGRARRLKQQQQYDVFRCVCVIVRLDDYYIEVSSSSKWRTSLLLLLLLLT